MLSNGKGHYHLHVCPVILAVQLSTVEDLVPMISSFHTQTIVHIGKNIDFHFSKIDRYTTTNSMC